MEIRSIMSEIERIEAEMEEVNIRFKSIDNPKLQDYLDRDAQIETLLKQRDELHEQYVSV